MSGQFYLKHKSQEPEEVIFYRGKIKMTKCAGVYRVIIEGVTKPSLITRNLGEATSKYTYLCYLYGLN